MTDLPIVWDKPGDAKVAWDQPKAQSVLGDAGVTIGSIGAQFNEGLARTADIVPRLGRLIRRQFDSSIPPLESKDPSGVRSAFDAMGVPVGTLDEQKQKYDVESGPVRRVAGTAARIMGEAAPFALIGPAGMAAKTTAAMGVAGTAGREAGNAIDPRLGDVLETTASLSAGLGWSYLERTLASVAAKASATPTADALRDLAKKSYDDMEKAGVFVSPQTMQGFATQTATELAQKYINPVLHPKATELMKYVADEAVKGPMSLVRLDQMRQVIKGELKGASEADAMRILMIKGNLDEMVKTLTPAQTVGGTTTDGVRSLMTARDAYSRAAKAGEIEAIITAAKDRTSTYTAAGYETALRNEFRKLVTNPNEMRLFKPEEQAALQMIVRGTGTGNVLRLLSKLAPQNIISAAGEVGLAASGQHMVAGAMAGTGLASRYMSLGITRKNIKEAEELIRRGYPASGVAQQLLTTYGEHIPLAVGAGAVTRQEE